MCSRFASIEYGAPLALAAVRFLKSTGMPCWSAYASSFSRDSRSHSRHGAMTRMFGASAYALSSKRTWSLPLPVAPCEIASAPVFVAISTSRFAIGVRAKHRVHEVADEFLLQVLDVDVLFLDAELQRLGARRLDLLALADIGSERHDLAAVRALQPFQDHRRVEPAGIRKYDFLDVGHV